MKFYYEKRKIDGMKNVSDDESNSKEKQLNW